MNKIVFLGVLCVITISSLKAASLVCGRIYLKNGAVIECTEKDRIKLPKGSGDLKLFRKAFYKDKVKEIYSYEEIDSIICWHAYSPEYLRKFVPSPKSGWLWVYLETPQIGAYVYSKKGYGIDDNGGIEVWVKQRTFSRSRTAYYLRKTDDSEFHDVGSASRNVKNSFRECIAEYISDDPELAKLIRQSNVNRSKTILMLQDYNPQKY